MKLNFSKFLRDRSSKATVPAAKFSGQRYGIGSSSFYDEDEEGDVKMVRPSMKNSNDESHDSEDSEFDGMSDEHTYGDDDSEFDYSDDMDDPEIDEESYMSAETARVLSDMIHNISSCDSEMCDSIKDWIETSDHFSSSDRDYLMQMFDDVSSDETDMDLDVEAEYDDYEDDHDFDEMDDDEIENDQDDSEYEMDDESSLDDKLNALKNRYKQEEEEIRFSSFAKKKF